MWFLFALQMCLESLRLRPAALSACRVPIEKPQPERKQVYCQERGPQQLVFGSPVGNEQRSGGNQRSNRKDLASLHPGWTQLVFSSSSGMHDDEQRRLGLPARVENLAAHERIPLHLSITECTRLFEVVEE